MPIDRAICEASDREDPLAFARDRFDLPAGTLYLDGNSLGALPRGVRERVDHAIRHEWGADLIASWNSAGWYEAPGRVGAKLAPLLGAAPDEVTIADSISVNLFKLLVAACRLRPDRTEILAEAGNFPSDNHIVESAARLLGLSVRFVPASDIADAVTTQTAIATLSHVNYRTALMQDMAAVTRAIHAVGALVVWDLAHSSGAAELALDASEVDFAVGCGYKYLNGGPGAPAHVFVARQHQTTFDQPLQGWFGHADPFRFADGFEAAPGIRAALCSTPPILSLLALEAALDAFAGVDVTALAAKGRALGDLFIRLADERLGHAGVVVGSPRDGTRRGSHVILCHPDGYGVVRALIRRGIVGDFRAPDAMRFGFAPLYIRYVDVWDAVDAMADVMERESWRDLAPAEAGAVT